MQKDGQAPHVGLFGKFGEEADGEGARTSNNLQASERRRVARKFHLAVYGEG